MENYNYKIQEVHISTIKAEDTVIHNGEMKTVCGKDLTDAGIFGVSLFGDSYHAGHKLVKKVVFICKE